VSGLFDVDARAATRQAELFFKHKTLNYITLCERRVPTFLMRRRQMRRFGSVTALLLFVSTNLFAQTTSTQRKRPVIGLALSGGSALGLAHIGVLRYLEEHRIPVDRIAGTSMGGLLGGLYATGHTAADLEKIVEEGDWDALLRSTSHYEDRSVSEKQAWNRITGPYSIPLWSSLSLPSGINSGQSLVQLLSGETAAYWDISSFDELPIPFRCVATDMLSGKAFVLRDGRLPRALRATMAIPGIFTPVDWNGRLLGDGGLVNNLPTDVAKDMGSDVVIGVILRAAPSNVLELRTLTDIVRQTINIAVTQNEERNRSLADVEIIVDLGNRNSLSFQETKLVIDAGYAAAALKQAALERLSVSPAEWEAYLGQKESRRRVLPASGKVAQVSASDAGIARSAATELNRKIGAGVSAKALEPLLTRLTSTASLPNAYFGWRSQSSPAGYDVEIEMRRGTEFMVRPSFFYQFSENEPGRPTLTISGTAIPGRAYKSRFIGALFVGPSPGISVEYYHPFDGSSYFIAPGITFERTRFYQYSGDDRFDHSRNRSSASLYAGIGTWRQLQLRIGARGGYDRYSDPMSAFGVPALNTSFVNPEVVGIINTQDSGVLPTRGSRVNGSAGFSFRKHSFPYLELNFDHFHLLSRDVSLLAMGKTNTSMGRSLTFYDQFTTGGLGELDAFRYQEIRGETVLMGGLGFLYRGMNPKNVAFRPTWGAWYGAGTIDSGSSLGWETKRSATAGVFTPTPLGLLGLSLGTDFNGNTRWRLSIGSFWNRP
jgi:NTE family protein